MVAASTNQIIIECLDCEYKVPYTPASVTELQCPHCGSHWREARYDYEALGQRLPVLLPGRPYDLWRYRELLPVGNQSATIDAISMGEGWTPLIHATNLGMMLGCPHIYIKDERQGPTASFKDRQAAVSIAALKEAGITEAVLASTGNVAISYSAYAARAGIKLWAFLTSLVPAEKMREVAIYGTQVVKVTASYDQAKQLAAEFARQRGFYLERGSRSIPSVEAMKTIAFEISEQLTRLVGQDDAILSEQGQPLTRHEAEGQESAIPPLHGPEQGASRICPHTLALGRVWRVPDWYFQAVSGGIGPLGVQKGFDELRSMHLTQGRNPSARLPAMANIQAEGCAPMVHAWKQGCEVAEPVRSPRTHIATLATGDPGRTYTLLYRRMLGLDAITNKSPTLAGDSTSSGSMAGGCFESVTDEETHRAMHILAKMEGISVEPAAAVAFAGLIKMARNGQVKPTEVVVVNCTGHTMPIEGMILGEGWARSVVLPSEYTASQTLGGSPAPVHEASVKATAVVTAAPAEEGLLAALNQVTADRFSSIAIVDDSVESRRLIRRILQYQGNYQLFEAADGYQAIRLAQRELPDLIILDLMMPGLDGFDVLDALKGNPRTASIPVIVVTAKELSSQENERLRGQIHSLMQKGEFMNDELLEEVQHLLK